MVVCIYMYSIFSFLCTYGRAYILHIFIRNYCFVNGFESKIVSLPILVSLLKKIRILLNTKGTYERIFKYFNANDDEKKSNSGRLDPPKHV